MRTLIRLRKVCKSYPLADSALGRLRTIGTLLAGRPLPAAFHALRNIDLEVNRGESLGLIGVNGAGKSTLLKTIAGVVRPTSGEIEIQGRVSALLELGAGFHPEYTGRQNVFLAAALMGLNEVEIRDRLEHILAFADIGEHIDQPLKHYSSGMVVRLGFAVATSVQPDILITDEVLAVGDESFQRKCVSWMENFLRSGGTLLLCSHSMFHIEKLCRKAAWVHDGEICAYGEAQQVTRDYIAWHEERIATSRPGAASTIQAQAGTHAVRSLRLNGSADDSGISLRMGDDLCVSGTIYSPDDRPPVVAIGLVKADGTAIYGLSSDMGEHVLGRVAPHEFSFALELPMLNLLPGRYIVRAHALDAEGYRLFDEVARNLVVVGETRELGLYRLPHRWLA
jgi:lipopolysaccharide transport system ATP-binding protein